MEGLNWARPQHVRCLRGRSRDGYGGGERTSEGEKGAWQMAASTVELNTCWEQGDYLLRVLSRLNRVQQQLQATAVTGKLRFYTDVTHCTCSKGGASPDQLHGSICSLCILLQPIAGTTSTTVKQYPVR